MTAGVDAACRMLDGLACVWISVPDMAAARLIFGDALGLQLRDQGECVPPGAATRVRWELYAAPDEHRGAICLFAGCARLAAGNRLPRGWDCVEAVVADVDAVADALAGCPGVTSVHPPFTSDLTGLGSNIHRSGIWRMPWGTHLVLTTGLTAPRGRSFPAATGATGRVFEVHLRTDRFAAVRRFYADVLGMPSLMDVELTDGPIHDAWSLPTGETVAMSFLKSGGRGTGDGAVEVQGHAAHRLQPRPGRDETPAGSAVVTWFAADLDGVRQALRRARLPVRAGPAVENTGPFAGHEALVFAGAEGELLHVVECA